MDIAMIEDMIKNGMYMDAISKKYTQCATHNEQLCCESKSYMVVQIFHKQKIDALSENPKPVMLKDKKSKKGTNLCSQIRLLNFEAPRLRTICELFLREYGSLRLL